MLRSSYRLGFLILVASALPFRAQTSVEAPAAALLKARALYYTPVDQGLQGFRCDVDFDWKSFVQKASNQAVPDDDARLKYLQSVRLTVDDDVRSGGALHWNAPAPAPDNAEDSVSRIREGLQQVWAGFLQSWNGFITGDLVSVDSKATVEHTPGGYRVAVRTGASLAEEQFSQALLLQSIHVTTPTLESSITPTFTSGPHGLFVSTISSSEQQPPSAPPTEVRMDVRYGAVGDFQLPSDLQVSVGPAQFEYKLVNCTVEMRITTR